MSHAEEKVTVDDNDGSIGYSGPWSPLTNSGSYDNSLHLATNIGASASLSFTGIAVNIVGSVSPCTTSGAPVTFQVTMNGAIVESGSIPCTTQTQNGVLFYSSGQLSNGPHTVSLINQGSSIPLLLDLFAYTTEIGVSGGDTGGGGSSTTANQAQVQSTPTSAGASPSSPSSAAGSGASGSSSASGGSSTGTPLVSGSSASDKASSSTTGSVFTVSTVMMLTTLNGVATTLPVVTTVPVFTTPTAISGGPNSSSPSPAGRSGSHSMGGIVGGIIAAVVVVVILLLLLLLYCRRRRKRRVDAPLLNHSPEILTPFNLNLSSSTEQAEPPTETPSSSVLPQLPLADLQTELPIFPTEKSQTPGEGPSASPSEPVSPESSYLFDEKRASGPSFTSHSFLNSAPPSLPRHSTPRRPPSSISPSEAVPAYARDTDTGRYRSGISTLFDRRVSQNFDTPPSYDSVRDADSSTRPEVPEGRMIVTDPSTLV